MSDKIKARLRRAKKTRARIQQTATTKLSIGRSNQHISAQIIELHGECHRVVAHASTMDKDFQDVKGSKTECATLIGKKIAEKAKEAGVTKIAFDRSGYRYHGRVKALAEAAREGGIEF
jgi:large subunit ribosomal protein L18